MEIVEWLLQSDPAIRWQVMRDLTSEPSEIVAAERSRVAREGWGGELLNLQESDGRWDGGTYRPGWADESKSFFDAWTATHFSLQLLVDFGVDPRSPRVQEAIRRVADSVRWPAGDGLYFEGEVEPCINGIVVVIGAYFTQPVDGIVDRLLGDQLPDGGWNCWAAFGATVSSFHTTICVLEGLAAWRLVSGGRSTCSSEDCSARVPPAASSILGSRCSRSRFAGTTTSSGPSTISARPAGRGTTVVQKRSNRSPTNRTRTAGGRWRTSTKARPTSRWKGRKGSPADGTRSGRCAYSPGPEPAEL